MRGRGGCLRFSMPDREVDDGYGNNGWVAVVC